MDECAVFSYYNKPYLWVLYGYNEGLGLSVISDKVFIASSTFVGIDYSYKLKINKNPDLYLGINSGGSFHH